MARPQQLYSVGLDYGRPPQPTARMEDEGPHIAAKKRYMIVCDAFGASAEAKLMRLG